MSLREVGRRTKIVLLVDEKSQKRELLSDYYGIAFDARKSPH